QLGIQAALRRERSGAGEVTDVGVRRRQGRGADARVRASHLGSRERLRAREARGRRPLGVVTGGRGRRAGFGRRARALPARVHRDPRAPSRRSRSTLLASTYCDTISLIFRAAVGMFTAQPTPMTLSEKMRS